MGRSLAYEVALDPSHFNPLQLQPRALVALSFNAGCRWLADHTLSHRVMVKQHQIGFVFYGAHLEYLEPLRYGDADSMTLSISVRVRGEGTQLENQVDYTAGGKKVAHLQTVAVPLWLEDSEEHSGVPATIGPALLRRFQPDEIDPSAYRCPVQELTGAAAGAGRLLAEHRYPVTLHRHHCEFLDQWFFAEALGFSGASRETLVLERGREKPEVRKGLSLPIRQVDVLYTRPCYLFDKVNVETRAYAVEERVTFTHRLVSASGDVVHSTLVERL